MVSVNVNFCYKGIRNNIPLTVCFLKGCFIIKLSLYSNIEKFSKYIYSILGIKPIKKLHQAYRYTCIKFYDSEFGKLELYSVLT